MIIYLACPYTDPDPDVQNGRAVAATKAAAHFMDQGNRVYSPITHGHAIAGHMRNHNYRNNHKFWLDQCYPQVINSEAVYILGLPGWIQSKGVRWECETARAFRIPIVLINCSDYSEICQLELPCWERHWTEVMKQHVKKGKL